MPYLDWSEQNIGLEAAPQADRETQLTLTLPNRELAAQLKTELEGVLATPGRELRLNLPRRWTIFWKAREGDSRLLLAHPEHDVWVATVAAEAEYGQLLLKGLDRVSQSGGGIDLASLGAGHSFNNLGLVIQVVGQVAEQAAAGTA